MSSIIYAIGNFIICLFKNCKVEFRSPDGKHIVLANILGVAVLWLFAFLLYFIAA